MTVNPDPHELGYLTPNDRLNRIEKKVDNLNSKFDDLRLGLTKQVARNSALIGTISSISVAVIINFLTN